VWLKVPIANISGGSDGGGSSSAKTAAAAAAGRSTFLALPNVPKRKRGDDSPGSGSRSVSPTTRPTDAKRARPSQEWPGKTSSKGQPKRKSVQELWAPIQRTHGFTREFWEHLANCFKGLAPNEQFASRPPDYNKSDLPVLIDGLRIRRKEVESKNHASDKFSISFCLRIEALLALLHIRPVLHVMTSDNRLLREGASTNVHGTSTALLKTIALPQKLAVDHLEDMAFLIKGTKHFNEGNREYQKKAGASLTQQSTMTDLVVEIEKMGNG